MKKLSFLSLIICLTVIFNVCPVSAVIIFKPDVMGGEVTDVVGKNEKGVETTMNKTKDASVITQLGEGFKETQKWVTAQVKKAKDFAEKVGEYKAAYDRIQNELINSKLMQIKAINDDISSIKQRYDNINAAIANATNNIQSALDADLAVLNGKMNTLEENKNTYNKLAEQSNDEVQKAEYLRLAQECDTQKAVFKSEIGTLNKEAAASVKSATSTLNSERKGIERDLKKLYADLALLLNYSESQDATQSLKGTLAAYFVGPEDNLTPDIMEEKRINRLTERRNSIVKAYQSSVNVIPDMMGALEEGEDQGYGASTLDTNNGAIGAVVELRIKNLQALKYYTDLMIADLKMKTAVEMAGITYYKLKKPNKDISKFNFDDYIFDISETEGK